MKLLMSLKELKLGQFVGWRRSSGTIVKEEDDVNWICLTQVIGFRKQTNYPSKNNGMAYTTKELINHKVVASVDIAEWSFFLGMNQRYEIETNYSSPNAFQLWLVENEKDYIEIVKSIMIDSM